jgi:hypothetical protein
MALFPHLAILKPHSIPVIPVNTYTPDFCCGFNCGQIGADLHWISASGGVTFSTAEPRTGTRSLRVLPASGVAELQSSFDTANSAAVIRFYIYFETLPSANTMLVIFRDQASADRYGVTFQSSTGLIKSAHWSNSGLQYSFTGSTGVAVVTGQWYRIDCRVSWSPNTMSVVSAVDGVSAGTHDASVAWDLSSTFHVGSHQPCTGEWFIDDFLATKIAADYPLGAGNVKCFVPVSDGTHNTGTAGNYKVGASGSNITDATTDSYLLIDEVPLDDTTPDTNDYINSAADSGAAATYVEHVFGLAPGEASPTVAPRAVDVFNAYHQANTGVGEFKTKLYDGSATADILDFTGAGSTATQYFRKMFANAPSGSGWSVGSLSALRHRFGYSNDSSPDQYLDSVMIEAEYPE